MNFAIEDSPGQSAFRAEVREFFARNVSSNLEHSVDPCDMSYEQYQVRRELGHLLNREPVPQRMQSCPEGHVGFMPVLAIQHLHQVLEPDVGFMYSPIEDFETRCTHLVNDCIFGAIAADYGACA